MAHVQTAFDTPTFGDKLLTPLREVGAFLMRMSEANVRVRELERLSVMSDAQLAKRGLAREDIVQHVYRSVL